jgi:hypothetical protein
LLKSCTFLKSGGSRQAEAAECQKQQWDQHQRLHQQDQHQHQQQHTQPMK